MSLINTENDYRQLVKKIKGLPEEYVEELTDFVEFLSLKAKKERKGLAESLEDLKKGRVKILRDKKDVRRHLQGIGL